MSNVKIFGKTLTREEVDALKKLAADAGCDPAQIQVVDSFGEPDPDGDDEVVLIPATPATCALPNLEKEMTKAVNGVRRAIWVWPKDTAPGEVPEATKKYSYSAVRWDAEKLRAVVADDDVTCFELPNGQPLPHAKMEHNLCVEDPKKKKKAT